MSDSAISAVSTFPRRHAATRRFTLGAPRSFTVADDGDSVLFLRSSGPTDPSNGLWAVRRGEEPRLLVDADGGHDGDLPAAERARRERAREQAGGIVTFAATADCRNVVFVLDGRLHRLATESGEHEVLAAVEPFDPRPAPDARTVAYVSGRGLRVNDGGDDREIPGTLEDDPSISWGSAEFVAAEEMGRSRGHWWTQDPSRLLATRVDVSSVDEWWISAPEDPSAPPRSIRYPAAGTANAVVDLWVVDTITGPIRPVDWRRGRYEYLATVTVTGRPMCVVQTRDQRSQALLEIDPDSGATTELTSWHDDRWVELVPGSPTIVGDRVATVIDHDGARRIALDGVPITPTSLNVRSIVAATGDDLIATVAIDPRGSVVGEFAPDGSWRERSDPAGYATAAAGGGTLCIAQGRIDGDTDTVVHWHDSTTTPIVSWSDGPGFDCSPRFSIGGRHRLHTALCLPRDHDGSPLPVLLDPYGGPHAQRVVLSRNAYASSQWFAEQGFAVVIVDGRGTPARGPDFERSVWGDLAGPVLDDQIDALQSLAETQVELDLGRVGIRGWSFGGYLAALAVIRRPDVFHAAIAGAPVTDWQLYDTHYTERYLGHPATHPEHYDTTSLLSQASQLRRPLLLIHGLADDNVVAAHTLQLSRTLLEAGRAHSVLPLAGITHMTPQEQVAENLLHLQRDFLHRELAQRR